MLNLAEYRKKPVSLPDYLPWACLVAPGVILNKDGSFLRAARYRGPDLDSATDAELVSIKSSQASLPLRISESQRAGLGRRALGPNCQETEPR